MEQAQRKTAINELSTDTRILINVLKAELIHNKHDFVSYKTLSVAIQKDVQKEARGLLSTARKHVQDEHHILLRPVIGKGIKKTDDLVGEAERSTKSIGKKARRAAREIVNAAQDKVFNNGEETHLNARLSQLGAIAIFAKPKSTGRIEQRIKELNIKTELPTKETLRLFAK